MNIQDWFPLGLTGLISLKSKGLSRVFSKTTVQRHQFLGTQPSLWSSSHIHTWLLEKPELWLDGPLSAKYYLWFLICYLSWPQLFFQGAASFNFMAAVTIHSDFGAQENKAFHCFHYFPIKWWGNSGNMMDAIFLAVWLLTFKPAFSLSSFTFIKRLFSFSLLSAIRVVSSALSEVIDISPSNLDFSLCFIQLSISHDVLCL